MNFDDNLAEMLQVSPKYLVFEKQDEAPDFHLLVTTSNSQFQSMLAVAFNDKS